MKLSTKTGLRGELIAYSARNSFAVVMRDDAPFTDREYSIHTILEDEAGQLSAVGGQYDLTYVEAMIHFVNAVTSDARIVAEVTA